MARDIRMLMLIKDRCAGMLPRRRPGGAASGSNGPGANPDDRPAVAANELVVSETDDGLYERLNREIFAFNAEATGHQEIRPVRVAVRGDDGDLIGGLCGWTWGGWGFIDLLWVKADHRLGGLGRRLLAAAEQEIRRRGCDQVALSTYSFQAPGFYRRAGYGECGSRPNCPHGYEQIQMTKLLT